MKINVFDATGKKLSPVEVKEVDFGGKVNKTLLAQALRVYEWNSHQRTSKVKTRGEITGSTRKIYKQKGTGGARHGDRYAPIFVGGGVAHGPKGIKTSKVLPKKMKRKALASAVLTKLEDNGMSAIDGLDKLKAKSSSAATLFAKIANHPKNSVLVAVNEHQDNIYKATRNLQGITVKRAQLINAKDLLMHSSIVLTKEALETLKNRINGNSSKEVKITEQAKSKPKPTKTIEKVQKVTK